MQHDAQTLTKKTWFEVHYFCTDNSNTININIFQVDTETDVSILIAAHLKKYNTEEVRTNIGAR